MSIIVNDLYKMDSNINTGGGMFGLNDNNSQTPDSTNIKPADSPPIMPANPFSGSPVPPPDPAASQSSPLTTPSSTKVVAPLNGQSAGGQSDDLLDLKQQALQNLQPLVSHLDQSPEEKFKTTMMLIQASDNSSLVRQAYEAANQITDEKARAQALLDVVNEINYFTHPQDQKEQ